MEEVQNQGNSFEHFSTVGLYVTVYSKRHIKMSETLP
jgi:hypothetical protein